MSRRRGGNHQPHVEEEDDDEEEEENIADEEEEEEEDEEDPLEHLPDYVIARVEQLQTLHAERETIMERYLEERAALEQKYEQLLQPTYQERARIVRGASPEHSPPSYPMPPEAPEMTAEMVAAYQAAAEAAARVPLPPLEDDEPVDGIPQFWACAMTRMETIGELLTVEDLDCLEHLMDISCHEHENGKGFTLTFTFEDNDYFTNRTLTKTYIVPNLLISDEPILKEVKGEKIYWKKNKSLTHKTVQKKQRGKGRYAGQVRSVTKQEEQESFFHWFTTPKMPTSVDDMDEEEAEQLEELFESDFEIAQAFRCHLVPNAVLWFTGKGMDGFMEQLIENATATGEGVNS